MTTSSDIVVDVELIGEEQLRIGYNSPLLADHILNYPSVPQEARSGQMRRLLCASAVGCFAGSVYFMLRGRGVEVQAMRSTGAIKQSEESDNPVGAIHIRVEVKIDEADVATLERVRELLEDGCLVTRPLSSAMPVTHEIVRV
jgi:organic hydroperoxide reductase OsmC/OhrA